MDKKWLKWTLFCVIVVVTTTMMGCATIVNGTNTDITISSDPTKANFTITDKNGMITSSGVTPSVVKLPNKNGGYQVAISLDGYKEEHVFISRDFNSMYLGNLLLGGPLGLIIDAVDGAMWKLAPGGVFVSLKLAFNESIGEYEYYAVVNSTNNNGEINTQVVKLQKI